MKPDSIFITGLGHYSALGQGKEALLEGLRGERSPLLRRKTVETRFGPREIAYYQADDVVLPASIPDSIKRRMARIAKMCFASAEEAVTDAFGLNLDDLKTAPHRTGIVVGSAFGCIELANAYQKRVILEGAAGASPSLFSGSVQNAMASQLSISLDIRGPASTVTMMDQSAIGSFRLAYDWLKSGIVDHALVTIGDELSDFSTYALADLGQTSETLNPLSDRCTAVAGEGMMSFILSRGDAVGKKRTYREITDVQLFSENVAPPADRYLAACYGAENQWTSHRKWIETFGQRGAEVQTHARLFGSMITSAAFEIGIAALQPQTDPRPCACIQMTSRGYAQFVSLR